MFRRRALITLITLISLIAVCTTTVVPGAAWAARDVTSLKQRAAAFEAQSAHLDALAGKAASRHNLAMDRVQQARDDAAVAMDLLEKLGARLANWSQCGYGLLRQLASR